MKNPILLRGLKGMGVWLLVFSISMPAGICAVQEETYFGNLVRNALRGVNNVVMAPAEVFKGVKEGHGGAGRPALREAKGLVDGTFNMITRFGSGCWDFVVMMIPGVQEGMPVEPEEILRF